jgi:hypothetical protein
LKNDEINKKESEIIQVNNKIKDLMLRENISSRHLKDACEKIDLPYSYERKPINEENASIVSS